MKKIFSILTLFVFLSVQSYGQASGIFKDLRVVDSIKLHDRWLKSWLDISSKSIYTSNDTITGNRVVELNGHALNFHSDGPAGGNVGFFAGANSDPTLSKYFALFERSGIQLVYQGASETGAYGNNASKLALATGSAILSAGTTNQGSAGVFLSLRPGAIDISHHDPASSSGTLKLTNTFLADGRLSGSPAAHDSEFVTRRQVSDSLSSRSTRYIINQNAAPQSAKFNISGSAAAMNFTTQDTSRNNGTRLFSAYNGPAADNTNVRWASGMIGVEGPLNTGSDYFLYRYDSTGNPLGTAMFIRRADGFTGVKTSNPLTALDVNGVLSVRATALGSTNHNDSLLVKSFHGEVKAIGIQSRLVSGNLFDKDSVVTGQYVDPVTGAIQTTVNNYSMSGYVSVEATTDYVLSRLGSVHYGQGIAYYDADTIFIGRTVTQQDSATYVFKTISGTAFVRFTCKTGKPGDNVNADSIRIEQGVVPSDFNGVAMSAITSINSLPIVSNYTTKDPTDSSSTVNLAYFNRHNGTTARTKGKKLLTFGDSITATTADTGIPITNWPTFAALIMGVDLENFAYSGASFTDWSTPAPRQQLSQQINDAIDSSASADIIVVSIGTNDFSRYASLGDYDTAMSRATLNDLDRSKIIEAARWAFWKIRTQWPDARCFYGMPLQRASLEYKDMIWLLDAVRDMANRYDFKIIEATTECGIVRDFETVGSNGRYLVDGLHPNTIGKQLQGAYYANIIMQNYLTY